MKQTERLTGELVHRLRYGGNPAQAPAGFYRTPGNDDPLALHRFKVVGGTKLNYNDYCDLDRLIQTLRRIEAVFRLNWGGAGLNIMVGIKRGSLCGAAIGIGEQSETEIARKVALGDKLAMFGGWIIANFGISDTTALALVKAGMEDSSVVQKFGGVVAPSFGCNVKDSLRRSGRTCRLMTNPALGRSIEFDASPRIKQVCGGLMVQPNYTFVPKFDDMEIYGERDKGLEVNLALAWAICCTSSSDTITLVNDGMLIGNGAGQPTRVGASKLAIERARSTGHMDKIRGAVAWSDSFFSYVNAAEVLFNNGIAAIFTTSGSSAKRGGGDVATIRACKRADTTLYMLPDEMARCFCC